MTPPNIEYTIIINPINANSPNIIDLIPFDDDSFPLPSIFNVTGKISDIFPNILFLIDSLFACIFDSLVFLSSRVTFSEVVGWCTVLLLVVVDLV